MKKIAVILIGRNTWVRIPVENNDGDYEELLADCEALGKALGGTLMYTEDQE